MDAIAISDHGAMRVRERCGVPRRAVRRLVERAWQRGMPLRGDAPHAHERAFGGFRFLFSRTENAIVLVTVLPIRVIDEDRAGVLAAEEDARLRRQRKRRKITLVGHRRSCGRLPHELIVEARLQRRGGAP